MANFYHNYDNFIVEILDKKELLSGRHYINPEQSELWILSQLTERRRKAAKNLLDNTHYISFNRFFELIRDVIIELYKQLDLSKEIYLYVGLDKNSSQYFVSIIALYFIKLLRYTEPIIIEELYENKFSELEGSSFIVIDDCSYSGNQSRFTMQNLYNSGLKVEYYLCFAVASQYSLTQIDKLSRDECNPEDSTEIWSEAIDISWIHPVIGLLIQHLRNNMENITEYLDIYYYFSPFTECGTPPISVYFDHKIAVQNSTFSYTLNLGCILPNNLMYKKDLIEIKCHEMIIEYLNLNEVSSQEKIYIERLIERYLTEMDQDCTDLQNENIQCIPFINECESYVDLKDISYFSLMVGFNNFYLSEYQKHTDIIDEINNKNGVAIKCFYKNLFN